MNDGPTYNEMTLMGAVAGAFLIGLMFAMDGCSKTERLDRLLRDCIRGEETYKQKVDAEVCKKIIEIELGKRQ